MIGLLIKDSDKKPTIEEHKRALEDNKNIIDELKNNNSKLQNQNIKIKKILKNLKKNLINIRLSKEGIPESCKQSDMTYKGIRGTRTLQIERERGKSKVTSNPDFIKIYLIELLRAKKVEIISYRKLAGSTGRIFDFRVDQ